ncbi:MAG: mannosyltransferase family protein [Hyphomicrobium sp.]|uniref:mannosyltransferase family protein n=1 Tax=Hyphomicrobium sp. TaxID=82 RepID=UPI0039E726AD
MSTDAFFLRRSGAAAVWLAIFERARPYAAYIAALAIFAASRAVVIAGVKFGELLTVIPDPTRWNAGPAWYHRLLRWDSGFYIRIAETGYQHSSDPSAYNSTAFYPLYPLLGRALASATGLDVGVALLIIANVSLLIAALLMTKLVKDEVGEDIALWSLAFFLFFPTAFFLSAGYTESLCLVFVLLSLITLRDERFLLASAFAGLALASRSVGIVLLPVILWEIYRHRSPSWPRTLATMVLSVVLATSGLTLYMIYLGTTFGDPTAFATSQAAWHQGTFVSRFVDALSLRPLHHGGWFLVFLPLVIWSFGKLQFPIALYGLGALMLPYLTLGITHSMNRFVLMCFPAFIAAAMLCRTRPLIACMIIAVFSAFLFQQSALFSQWYWVG